MTRHYQLVYTMTDRWRGEVVAMTPTDVRLQLVISDVQSPCTALQCMGYSSETRDTVPLSWRRRTHSRPIITRFRSEIYNTENSILLFVNFTKLYCLHTITLLDRQWRIWRGRMLSTISSAKQWIGLPRNSKVRRSKIKAFSRLMRVHIHSIFLPSNGLMPLFNN